jgi:predicted NAD-dependent protein-ADP-ribosyltransferase YbiA (DUF1768 family)
MAFITGMSKEGKKLMNSTDEAIQKDIKNLLSPEDLAILERNCKKENEKMMKQLKKMGFS